MNTVDVRRAVTGVLQRAFKTHYYRQVARRISLMQHHRISLVFDIGANEGQFALELRRFGYKGRIVSFEPMAAAFDTLVRHSRRDPAWTGERIALGDWNGQSDINVSANSQSNSLLNMNPRLLEAAPETRFVAREPVEVRRLDSILHNFKESGDVLYVKIDAQGFEKKILDGARGVLDEITGLQLEVALVQLYENAVLFRELLDYMDRERFALMGLEPEFSDPRTGQLLETDCIFFRPDEGRGVNGGERA